MNYGGTVTESYNIFYGNTAYSSNDASGFTLSATGVTGQDTKLPTQTDNYGGPTQTMIPLLGSVAICAGSASAAASEGLNCDQRGVSMGTLTPSSASTYTGAGGYCSAGSIDAGAVQTVYSLSMATPAALAPATQIVAGSAFTDAVTLYENSSVFAGASISIPALTFAGTEFKISGLLNSDSVSRVTLTSSGAAATATVSGGPYAIVPSSASGTGLSNYTIGYVNGSLTVRAAALSVTVNNATMIYGSPLPALSGSVVGILDNDSIAVNYYQRENPWLCRGGSSSCTPCMIDSLEVRVLFTSRWGEVIAKRKGVIARWGLKEAWSKDASRWTKTGYEAYGTGRAGN